MTLVALIFALILMAPLFAIPRPANVSSIPWKVELLFSIFIALSAVGVLRARRADGPLMDQRIAAFVIALALFSLWSGLSMIWATSWWAALHHTLVWLNYGVLFVVCFIYVLEQRGTPTVVRSFAILALLIGALAVLDFATLADFTAQEGTIRIRYAKYAELLVIIAPLLFSIAVLSKKPKKIAAALVPASLCWIAVMLSLSKGALIAGVTGIGVFFVFTALFRRSARRKTLVVAAYWLLLTVGFQLGVAALTSVPSTTDYISGSSDSSRSTSSMRVFTWKVGYSMAMMNPILGVGADNFGIQFNPARREYAVANPDSTDSSIGEDYLFERAHNEPLQVLAELGVIGIFLFVSVFLIAAWVYISEIVKERRRVSPVVIACAAGALAFGVSSLFSSFSFRAYQNGIVLFVVLALGFSRLKSSGGSWLPTASLRNWKPVLVAFPIALALLSGVKGASQFLVYYGGTSETASTAIANFGLAARLDPDNPGAELAIADTFARERQWPSAVPYYRRAIDGGLGVSIMYSSLAKAQEGSGDLAAAEGTLKESTAIFPRSTFLHARLALVQEAMNKSADSETTMRTARSIDERQANGWYFVIRDGVAKAHARSEKDPSLAAPRDLVPAIAIYPYSDEKFGPASPE